jgi:hypothetical protein
VGVGTAFEKRLQRLTQGPPLSAWHFGPVIEEWDTWRLCDPRPARLGRSRFGMTMQPLLYIGATEYIGTTLVSIRDERTFFAEWRHAWGVNVRVSAKPCKIPSSVSAFLI